MKNKRQLAINLIASSIAFIVGPCINLILYPFIIKNIGVEAFGFAGLAVSFIGYAQLATVAINSMAGRFITVKIHENDYESANRYFNSVLVTNLLVALFLLVSSVFCIIYLEKLVKIPADIMIDVKMLFSFIFAGFLINAVDNTFGVGVFATNRLDISSVRDIITGLIRGALLFFMYYFFQPRVAYLGIATFTVTVVVFITNIIFTKILLPEIKITWKFDLKAVLEIASSGVWNLFTRLGAIMGQGIDLLIANLFISPTAMGVLSVSKTIPILMMSVLGMFNGVFAPQITISYAKKDFDDIKKQLNFSIKMLGMLTVVPISIVTVFGADFYRLWVPGQDAGLLYKLTMISIIGIVFSGPMGVMGNVFTAVNRIKTVSIVIFFESLLSAIIVLTVMSFIKGQEAGIFIIVAVSSLLSILLNITFIPIYAAKCLNFNWYTFYPLLLKNTFVYAVLSVMLYILSGYFKADTWFKFVISCVISGAAGLVLGFYIMFGREEKNKIFELVKNSLK